MSEWIVILRPGQNEPRSLRPSRPPRIYPYLGVRQPDDPNSPVFGSSRGLEISVVELLRGRQIVKEKSFSKLAAAVRPG